MPIIIIVVAVALLFGGYLYMNNESSPEAMAPAPQEEKGSNSPVITWKTEALNKGPAGGSDFIASSRLTLEIDGKAYVVNDYLNDGIAGCGKYGTDSYDGIISQYNAEYWPAIMEGTVSSHLCAAMAGGNLFVVAENKGEYQVKRYHFGDFSPEDPEVLFTIK